MTPRLITQNLWLSAAINVTAIVLAGTGSMGPVLGALWHNAGSVLVVANSAMLMSTQRQPADTTAEVAS